MAARMAMMTMTMRSSTNVKPLCCLECIAFMLLSLPPPRKGMSSELLHYICFMQVQLRLSPHIPRRQRYNRIHH